MSTGADNRLDQGWFGAGQHCSCGRFTTDADHLHTCHQHSGNWYAAHEHILTVVEEIVRAAD